MRDAVLQATSVVSRLESRAVDTVLLTFDDGPHPEVTPGVLDHLERFAARAVFFVVGNRIPRAPWILKEIRDRGHVIGNHTYHHDARSRGIAASIEDVGLCQEAVQIQTGMRPTLFRPPLGSITIGGLCAARYHRLKVVRWSVDSGDWSLRTVKAARERGEYLSRIVGPRDIVLLHDDNPCVLDVLDVLLPALARRGLGFRRSVPL